MRVERLVIVLGALIGAVGLFLFGRHVWHAGTRHPGRPGFTVRSEVLTIYAPKSLIDFAKAHPQIETNDELVRLIREAKLNVWFAMVDRNHQASGLSTDILLSYRPGERPDCFEITKTVLSTLAGNPRGLGTEAYSTAQIEVLEEAMMVMDPVEGSRRLRIR
jgi:hypothetical protein